MLTDFSDAANIARDYAVQLAQILESEIVLINTYHIPYAGATSGALVNVDGLALEEAEKNMKEQMDYCEKNFSNVPSGFCLTNNNCNLNIIRVLFSFCFLF